MIHSLDSGQVKH